MLLRNAWYVAAWSSEIPVDELLARTILNVPVALWRDTTGKVVAFEDRCCHRGAPLGIPRHPATQSTNIRPPIPRSSGRAVGAQRRRFALLV